MSIENVRAHLAAQGLADRIVETEGSTATVELAAAAFGIETGRIAKTLAFLLDADHPVLVVAEGDARVDNHKFRDAFHAKAKMIPRDEVERHIGHAAGGVCPFAVNEGVPIYLDESLRRWDVVYPAAGNAHSAVRLTLDELERASGATGWVDVCSIKSTSRRLSSRQ